MHKPLDFGFQDPPPPRIPHLRRTLPPPPPPPPQLIPLAPPSSALPLFPKPAPENAAFVRPSGAADTAPPNYKVVIRNLINVFKTIQSIQSATLQLLPDADRITIVLDCLHGVRKVLRALIRGLPETQQRVLVD